jgi:DNA-binding CsgD family transcriptional regulator
MGPALGGSGDEEEVVRVDLDGDEGFGGGSGRDPDRPEAGFAGRQVGKDGAPPVPDEDRTGGERSPASWVNWQSALYALVLGMVCLFLVPLTSLWWIAPLLGAAAPIALAVLGRSESAPEELDARKNKERELLEALAERRELTPSTAAMRTSLTLDEASKMLDGLAGEGRPKLRTQDGIAAYSLPEHHARSPETDAAPEASRARSEPGAAPARQPDEPLSERELEVLALLASGRTNAEVARDLFVASGTVKSHANSIYRKLGAKNRAGAVARARELGLLR